jgi:polygalacturonase
MPAPTFPGRPERRDFLKLGAAGAAGAILVPGGPVYAPAETHSAPADQRFDVRAFGAKGDGSALDTPAINKAIEAASAAGGGMVHFPAGSYLCFSIHLKTNVALYLNAGATILAADTPASGGGGYDPPEPNQWDHYQDFGHSHWHNSLIWGEEISNVSILGPGLIWGKGLNRGAGDTALAPGVGNKSISLKNCHNVTLRDFSILHGGHFGILATGVDNLTIDNLRIDTNRDAIDVDCCRNARISNCSVNSPWDDGICLKDSYGLGLPRSTDNVTITNCYVTGGYEEGSLLDATFKRIGPDYKAPRNGRIKFGTESNAGFRNITISNCVVELCRGIALESVDGAILEDVCISNITMRELVDVPFFVRLGSRMRGPSGVLVGNLRRVRISDVVASVSNPRQSAIISGIPAHPIEDISFNNICLLVPGGGTKDDAAVNPEEIENVYPDPNRFGPMPAHGFFVRHVRGINMRDIEIRCLQEDLRPAFVLNDVETADFTHISAPRAAGATWELKNVKDFNVWQSRPVADLHFDSVSQKSV